MTYRTSWDLSTIPDNLILSRAGQIRNAQRKTRGAGPGRPRKDELKSNDNASLRAEWAAEMVKIGVSAQAAHYARQAWSKLLDLNNLRENSV